MKHTYIICVYMCAVKGQNYTTAYPSIHPNSISINTSLPSSQ